MSVFFALDALFLVGVPALDGGTFSQYCISVKSTIGLCIGIEIRCSTYSNASRFYTGCVRISLCTLFTIDFIMGVIQCALCTVFTN